MSFNGVQAFPVEPWFNQPQTNTGDIDSLPAIVNAVPADAITPVGADGVRSRGISVIPYGNDSGGQIFEQQLIGWRPVLPFDGDGRQSMRSLNERLNAGVGLEFRPRILAKLTCTLNAAITGTAGGLGSANLLCDVIATTVDIPADLQTLSGMTLGVHSPADSINDGFWWIADASHVYSFFTLRHRLLATGTAWSGGSGAGALVQSIF